MSLLTRIIEYIVLIPLAAISGLLVWTGNNEIATIIIAALATIGLTVVTLHRCLGPELAVPAYIVDTIEDRDNLDVSIGDLVCVQKVDGCRNPTHYVCTGMITWTMVNSRKQLDY